MGKDFTITEDEVRHIAKLANISLTEDEVKLYRSQFAGILGYVQKIVEFEDLDSGDGVVDNDMAKAWSDHFNISRDDKVKDSLPVEEALKNRKDKVSQKGHFVVKAVFGEGDA